MNVKIKQQDGISIVSLIGKLDSASSNDVQDTILEKVTLGVTFVFDMQACDFISSAGLRVLLIIAKRIKVNNASAAMSGLSNEIMEVMQMTGFDEMFDSYSTVDEAIKSLT